MQDIYYPEIDQTSMIMKETYYGITRAPKKYHRYTFLKINDATKESHYSTKIKYNLLIHFQEERFFGIQQSHIDQQIATMRYNQIPMKINTTYSYHIQY